MRWPHRSGRIRQRPTTWVARWGHHLDLIDDYGSTFEDITGVSSKSPFCVFEFSFLLPMPRIEPCAASHRAGLKRGFSAQSGPRRCSFVHGELLAQGRVLQGELTVAAAEEGQETEQVEQEGNHRAGIVSGSELRDQRPAHRAEFWRRTGHRQLTCSREQTDHVLSTQKACSLLTMV
jgi:hypothetical protein